MNTGCSKSYISSSSGYPPDTSHIKEEKEEIVTTILEPNLPKDITSNENNNTYIIHTPTNDNTTFNINWNATTINTSSRPD